MRWIAIDFGTTNSAVACYGPRGPEVIKVEGQELVPSVVTIEDDGAEVGQRAVRARERGARHSFASFKRHLAETYNVEEAKAELMTPGSDGKLHYLGPDGTTYSPEELAGYVYGKLRNAASLKLKEDITSVIATVPATFNEVQRAAIKEAAKLGGFETIELLDEPTAAAIAYGYDFDRAMRVAVVDVGGGTTDIAIIECGRGLVKVLATNGTPLVGGDDWDRHIRGLVVSLHEAKNPASTLAARPLAMNKLLAQSEQAKRRLTDEPETRIELFDVDKNPSGADVHVIEKLDRELMDQATTDLLAGIRGAMDRTLAEARARDPKFTVRDLDSVIMVGGQTRVHAIQRLVAEFFGQEPRTDIDPETAVVLGAAIQAGIREGRKADLTIRNITPHAYAIETHGASVPVATELVPKGAAYGHKASFLLSNRDPDQARLTVRLLQGDSFRPAECIRLWSRHIEVEPGAARSARVRLSIEIGASGEPIVTLDDERVEAAT